MTTEGPPFDPKTLQPGTCLHHRSGGWVVLARRKEDDSGWWNTDGSGLADRAAMSGDWQLTHHDGCETHPANSRMCERGTKSCIRVHLSDGTGDGD